tara:strand:+ start:265 stop:423 length:159 start_codon:yes stop_codon:yes gene_type:complete
MNNTQNEKNVTPKTLTQNVKDLASSTHEKWKKLPKQAKAAAVIGTLFGFLLG